ncbi:hypothetical protein C6Q17_07470 [Burkholderia contaminans]|nr:hypothetical protein C6Q17_07470 [Burkholderia contaminans]
MNLRSILKWVKRFGRGPEPSGVFKLGHGIATPATGMGRSPFSDAIVRALASVGALPGDIVEVNEFGMARVVGRRPHLANEQPDMSEQAIRAALERYKVMLKPTARKVVGYGQRESWAWADACRALGL